MKTITYVLFFALHLSFFIPQHLHAENKQKQKPNIVFVMTDD
jgi:hypothetical protein